MGENTQEMKIGKGPILPPSEGPKYDPTELSEDDNTQVIGKAVKREKEVLGKEIKRTL
jgi:hypothetical protein